MSDEHEGMNGGPTLEARVSLLEQFQQEDDAERGELLASFAREQRATRLAIEIFTKTLDPIARDWPAHKRKLDDLDGKVDRAVLDVKLQTGQLRTEKGKVKTLEGDVAALKDGQVKAARESQNDLLNTEQRLAMSAKQAAEVIANQVVNEKVDDKVAAGLNQIRLENLGDKLASAQRDVSKLEGAEIRKADHERTEKHSWWQLTAKTGLHVVGWLAALLVAAVVYLLINGSPFRPNVEPQPSIQAPALPAPSPVTSKGR